MSTGIWNNRHLGLLANVTAGKSVPANVTGRQMSAGKALAGKSPAGIRVFTKKIAHSGRVLSFFLAKELKNASVRIERDPVFFF